MIEVRNRVINEPIEKIVSDVKLQLTNGKLANVLVKSEEISVPCPCHSYGLEKHNSCFINKETGIWHCFSCSASGNISKFIGACFDRSESYGEKWLVDNYEADYIKREFNLPEIVLNKKETTREQFISDSELTKFESYHPYMTKRKLTEEVIKKFDIKYDKDTKCLVFPVRDINGKIKFLTRRSVENKKFIIDKDADKKHNLYLLHEAKKYKTVVIVESQINALTCWAYGIPAVSLFGCGVPKEQIEVLNDTPIRKFVLMFDGDGPGRSGAKRFKDYISKTKFITDIVMPVDKDVNDLTKEEFINILRKNGENYEEMCI